MAQKTAIKSFKDNIHGYISIPSSYITYIIDTEHFQRLRYIEQTSMRILYPSARHDRFAHSIGVYHLGSKVFNCFIENIKDNGYFKTIETDYAKYKILFEIACLLHDVGHAPFSHTLEKYYGNFSSKQHSLIKKFNVAYSNTELSNDISEVKPSEHEFASGILIKKIFKTAIQSIVKTELNIDITDDDLMFISRAITGCKFTEINEENSFRNCLISLLNSNYIDVDKLDYIIRDAKMSGISNIEIDIERLCASITIFSIVTIEDSDITIPNNTFIISFVSGQKAKVTSFDGNIDGEILFCGKATLRKCHIKFKGKALISKTIKAIVGSRGHVVMEGIEYSKEDPITIPSSNQLRDCDIDAYFEDATIEFKNLTSISSLKGEVLLNKISTLEFHSTYLSGNLKGKYNLTAIKNEALQNQKESYEVAYNKGALSVIQNVSLARNYEYLWIYGHHKVVYFSEFLFCQLLEKAFKCHKSHPWEVISVDLLADNKSVKVGNFYFKNVTDSDLISFIKYTYEKFKDDPSCSDFKNLYNEFFTRRYKKSLFKTHSEVDLFSKDWSYHDRIKIKKKLIGDKGKFADISANFKEFVESKNETTAILNLIIIDSKPSLKYLDVDNVFVKINEDIVNLKRLNIFESSKIIENTDSYFYMYYTPTDSFDKERFKKQVKDFLTKVVN